MEQNHAEKGGNLFVELMPLLAGRTVLITVAKVDDMTLRVNVIPTQAKADENPALTTPLTYTGSAEELDAELGKHLAGYVQVHQQTTSTLAEAKATMEAAAKAAQEEANRKAQERKKAAEKASDNVTSAKLPDPLRPAWPSQQALLEPNRLRHRVCSAPQCPTRLQRKRKEVLPSNGSPYTFPLLQFPVIEAS